MTTLALAILMGSSQVGLAVGSSFAAFEPYWITGPYAGTNQCPVCQYTFLPMVYVYAKRPSDNLVLVAKALQSAVDQVGADKIKTFIIDPNLAGKDKESISTFEPWAKKAEPPKVWWLSRPKKLVATTKTTGWIPLTFGLASRFGKGPQGSNSDIPQTRHRPPRRRTQGCDHKARSTLITLPRRIVDEGLTLVHTGKIDRWRSKRASPPHCGSTVKPLSLLD